MNTAVAADFSELPHEAEAYAKSLAERIAVLEAHWQDTRDSYVRKDQLVETRGEFSSGMHALRADVHKLEVRLIMWFVTTALLVVGAFYMITVRTDARIGELAAEVRATNARIDKMQGETNAKFDQINQRLDRLFELAAAQQAAR